MRKVKFPLFAALAVLAAIIYGRLAHIANFPSAPPLQAPPSPEYVTRMVPPLTLPLLEMRDPVQICKESKQMEIHRFMTNPGGPGAGGTFIDCDGDLLVDLIEQEGITLAVVNGTSQPLNLQYLRAAREEQLPGKRCSDGAMDEGKIGNDAEGNFRLSYCGQVDALNNPYIERKSQRALAAQELFNLMR